MNSAVGRNAILWAVATLLMLPAFAMGHIISDNSFTNVNWSEGFARQLFSGHLYPRWLPQMNAGAGSPVFYFYGPLPFYLTAPFHLIVGPRLAVLFGMWLMLALSGQAFQALAANFVGATAALLASLAYMAMPYHFFVDVWLRSDMGELGVYIFMPICLLSAFRLASRPLWTFVLAVSLSGVLLSHLPTALLFAPFLAAFCLFIAIQNNAFTVLVRSTIAALLGFGIAATYIVPALLLQNLIHANHWGMYQPSGNLLFVRLSDTLELFLDAVAIIEAVLVTIFATGLVANAEFRRSAAPWFVFALTAFLLTSPAAFFLWEALPPVFDKIQFAWRALAMLDVAFCMLLALTLEEAIWSPRIVFRAILFGLVSIAGVFLFYQIRSGHFPPEGPLRAYEDIEIARHAESLEYLPSCRPSQRSDKSDGSAALIAEHVMREKPSNEIPVFYYPFLKVHSKGALLPTSCDRTTGFMVVGQYRGDLEIRTDQLQPERIGNWLSLASLIIVFFGLVFSVNARVQPVASRRSA